MAKVNIFKNAYEKHENRFTYNFFFLLELLNSRKLMEFLTNLKVAENPIKDIAPLKDTEPLKGAQNSDTSHDGSFDVKLDENKSVKVFYENKTYYRNLSLEQIKGHLKIYCQDESSYLLVTTPRTYDGNRIKGLNDKRVIFKSWAEIAKFLKKEFVEKPEETPYREIVKQFIDYGEKSREFNPIDEIDKSEITSYIESKSEDKIFYKFDHIFRILLNEVQEKFEKNDEKFLIKNRTVWGRKGIHISLKDCKYQQFIAIALYYNTEDHGIAFKDNHTPEIAFFFDVTWDKEKDIRNDDEFKKLAKRLAENGFESNLEGELTKNLCRVLVFRRPLSEFDVINVDELIKFIEEVTEILEKNGANECGYFADFRKFMKAEKLP